MPILAISAWLNYVNGAVDWNQTVLLQDGTTPSLSEALVQVERILEDPHSMDEDYVQALVIAEAINVLDEGNSSCD